MAMDFLSAHDAIILTIDTSKHWPQAQLPSQAVALLTSDTLKLSNSLSKTGLLCSPLMLLVIVLCRRMGVFDLGGVGGGSGMKATCNLIHSA